MKKIFNFSKAIVILTVLFTAITAYANDKTTAVLQHGDTPQAFYGANAFKEAMEAAQHGDRISLSSGVFNQTTINKAVKIQGAGLSTQIYGDTEIAITNSHPGLEVEGINFLRQMTLRTNDTLNDATFKRCRFSNYFTNNSHCINNTFIQCQFVGHHDINSRSNIKKGIFYTNCTFGTVKSSQINDDINFKNCVISDMVYMSSGNVSNSIIKGHASTAVAMKYSNVITPSDRDTPHPEAWQENIIYLTSNEINALFKEGYELTDEAATKYLGSDGKQLGAYGGAFPFTLTPAIPEITSVKIDPLVKEDGKLSISISAKTNN